MATHYVETSIPSFYFEVRPEPAMVARRDWTRQWWASVPADDELVTSPAVVDEQACGDFPGKRDALALGPKFPAWDRVSPKLCFAACQIAASVGRKSNVVE